MGSLDVWNEALFMIMKTIKSISGFSLVEILVAVGILAGAVATLMPAVEVSSMLSVEDEKMFKAATLANNKMALLEQELWADIERGKVPDETVETGYFEKPFDDYQWEYEIKKVEIPMEESAAEGQNANIMSAIKVIMKEIAKAVREVKVTVRWPDRTEEKDNEFSITTHVVNIK